ncbi:MAG: response regulator [Xanthobacteraceae bacterium]|jgi:class 3 adenylate cyclase
MHNPPRILIVDDSETNRDLLVSRLGPHGFDLVQAADGEEAIETARATRPDLILLDVVMPKLDGVEATKRLKADASLPFTPIILVTSKTDAKDVVAGLEAGADEYLTKPVDSTSLLARVKSMLRVKEMHDKIVAQADDLATWNRTLEKRVADQLGQIERVSRLKRFLAPQVAELIVAESNEQILESHRREITVVFGDLRGFTGFAETAEPEEVIAVLRDYHTNLGPLVHKYAGTLERFLGDGFLILFNDPLPCADPSIQAVKMAIEMRDRFAMLAAEWRNRGHDLGFSMGISHGFATLGRIGFEGRFEYSAVGNVVNLAARLCAQAGSGQILTDPMVRNAVQTLAEIEPAGEFLPKGFSRRVQAFNVVGLRESSDHPASR